MYAICAKLLWLRMIVLVLIKRNKKKNQCVYVYTRVWTKHRKLESWPKNFIITKISFLIWFCLGSKYTQSVRYTFNGFGTHHNNTIQADWAQKNVYIYKSQFHIVAKTYNKIHFKTNNNLTITLAITSAVRINPQRQKTIIESWGVVKCRYPYYTFRSNHKIA